MSAASGGPGASLADVVNGGGRAGGVFGRGVIGLSRNSGGSGHGQGQGGGNGPSGGDGGRNEWFNREGAEYSNRGIVSQKEAQAMRMAQFQDRLAMERTRSIMQGKENLVTMMYNIGRDGRHERDTVVSALRAMGIRGDQIKAINYGQRSSHTEVVFKNDVEVNLEEFENKLKSRKMPFSLAQPNKIEDLVRVKGLPLTGEEGKFCADIIAALKPYVAEVLDVNPEIWRVQGDFYNSKLDGNYLARVVPNMVEGRAKHIPQFIPVGKDNVQGNITYVRGGYGRLMMCNMCYGRGHRALEPGCVRQVNWADHAKKVVDKREEGIIIDVDGGDDQLEDDNGEEEVSELRATIAQIEVEKGQLKASKDQLELEKAQLESEKVSQSRQQEAKAQAELSAAKAQFEKREEEMNNEKNKMIDKLEEKIQRERQNAEKEKEKSGNLESEAANKIKELEAKLRDKHLLLAERYSKNEKEKTELQGQIEELKRIQIAQNEEIKAYKAEKGRINQNLKAIVDKQPNMEEKECEEEDESEAINQKRKRSPDLSPVENKKRGIVEAASSTEGGSEEEHMSQSFHLALSQSQETEESVRVEDLNNTNEAGIRLAEVSDGENEKFVENEVFLVSPVVNLTQDFPSGEVVDHGEETLPALPVLARFPDTEPARLPPPPRRNHPKLSPSPQVPNPVTPPGATPDELAISPSLLAQHFMLSLPSSPDMDDPDGLNGERETILPRRSLSKSSLSDCNGFSSREGSLAMRDRMEAGVEIHSSSPPSDDFGTIGYDVISSSDDVAAAADKGASTSSPDMFASQDMQAMQTQNGFVDPDMTVPFTEDLVKHLSRGKSRERREKDGKRKKQKQ